MEKEGVLITNISSHKGATLYLHHSVSALFAKTFPHYFKATAHYVSRYEGIHRQGLFDSDVDLLYETSKKAILFPSSFIDDPSFLTMTDLKLINDFLKIVVEGREWYAESITISYQLYIKTEP